MIWDENNRMGGGNRFSSVERKSRRFVVFNVLGRKYLEKEDGILSL